MLKMKLFMLAVLVLVTVRSEELIESNLRDLSTTATTTTETKDTFTSKCAAIVSAKANTDCSNIKFTGYSCCRITWQPDGNKEDKCVAQTTATMNDIQDVLAKKPLPANATEDQKYTWTVWTAQMAKTPITIVCEASYFGIKSLLGLLFLTMAFF